MLVSTTMRPGGVGVEDGGAVAVRAGALGDSPLAGGDAGGEAAAAMRKAYGGVAGVVGLLHEGVEVGLVGGAELVVVGECGVLRAGLYTLMAVLLDW